MEQQQILQLALERTEAEAFKAFAKSLLRDQSKGRTIFSKAAAVLKAAPENSLDSCRMMLHKIIQRNADKDAKFGGVKTEQLQQLIKLLFGEGAKLLDPKVFAGCERKQLLAYLEICRRYFMVIQGQPYAPQRSRTPAVTTARPKEAEPDWMKNEFSITFALEEGNKECAAYVLENQKMYRDLVAKAKQLVGKEA